MEKDLIHLYLRIVKLPPKVKPKVVEKIVEKEVIVKEPTEIKVNINSVEPNREQPRKAFEEDSLEELAESIREYGIFTAIACSEERRIL